MIQAITLFPPSIDSEVFESLFAELESSLKQFTGFLSIKVNKGHIMSPGGPPPFSKVIEFSFDSLENMMAWTQSDAAQSQKENMLKLNSIMIYFEVKES